MSTETNKKLFLQQVEQILEGVMQDKDKVNSYLTLHSDLHWWGGVCVCVCVCVCWGGGGIQGPY